MYGFITYQDILEYGISESYLKIALIRNRQGKTKGNSWHHIRDPRDKRKILIYLDTIPLATYKKYNLPTAKEYEAFKEKQEEEKRQQEKEFEDDQNLKILLDACHGDWIKYHKLYTERLAYNPKAVKKYATLYAKEHAFWLAMVQVSGGKYATPHGMGGRCFEYYQKITQKVEFNYILKNGEYFRVKLKSIKEHIERGYSIVDVIVDGSLKPRPEYAKTTQFHKSLIFSYLSHPKAYSYRVVAEMVNHLCQQQGYETLSESVIKSMMSTDNEFRTLVDARRKGKKHANDCIMPYTERNEAQYPHNTWLIDGTPLQFFCKNENGTKTVRLNLFVILDVCSRKVVGFDISYSENRYNILNALKMAVMSEGCLPKEIVSDNFSASKTQEIQDLQMQLLKMEVHWRFSKVGNPQDKGQIERFFGTFQTVEQALYNDYIGEGITSTRKNRPSPEYLQEVMKKQGSPSFNEARNRTATMIAKYNERQIGNRKSPNEVCKTFPKPYAVQIDNAKTALMFWKKTSYTVKRGMVKITVNKTQYSYEIQDHKHKLQLQNQKVTVRYDEKDLDWIMLFDYETDQPICECEKSIRVHMSLADQTPQDIINMQIATAKQKSYKKYVEDKAQEIIDKGLEEIGVEELELIHPLALDKNKVNTEESKQFLELYQTLNSVPDTTPETDKKEYKILQTLTHSKATDAREMLLENKKPARTGSLKTL